MVGIVIVSHSARLADGVVELAREMAGPDVAMVAAGGLDLPDRPLGTDAALIERAIDEAWADDGVLVLMDLGSAVLSAEMAAEMLPDERRSRVLLCEAPLVEGAVAAAVAARLGDPLDQVAAEARGGLAGKVAHLASGPDGEPAPPAGRGAGRRTRPRAAHHGRRPARPARSPGGQVRADRRPVRRQRDGREHHGAGGPGQRAEPERRRHPRRPAGSRSADQGLRPAGGAGARRAP